MNKYTWTQLNEMSVDDLRGLVVDLGKDNPEFIGQSKKQKPFLLQMLWNNFMATGQASFDDAGAEEDVFSDVNSDDDFIDFDDLDDGDWESDMKDKPTTNGMADGQGNKTKGKSKKIDTNIGHTLFTGMISNGATVTNVTVTISCGSMSNNYPVIGKTIYQVEKMMGQILNVNPYARIVLANGNEVTGDYVIKEGDVVEFVNEAYDKG